MNLQSSNLRVQYLCNSIHEKHPIRTSYPKIQHSDWAILEYEYILGMFSDPAACDYKQLVSNQCQVDVCVVNVLYVFYFLYLVEKQLRII